MPLEEHVPFEERRQRRGQLAQVDGEPSRVIRTAARNEGGEGPVPPLDDDGSNVRRLDCLAREDGAGGRAQPAAAGRVPRRRDTREASGRRNSPERDGLGGTELQQQLQEEVHCESRRGAPGGSGGGGAGGNRA